MNLIERLGGYEYLNGFYKRAVAHGFTLTEIKDSLLQYRRQHNIFENGDKAVYIYDCENSMLFTVKDITDKGYSFGNDWGWRGVISNMGVGNTLRHATDAEIKAGKRLEVKSEN
ncbi:MAG: hypothetical protein L0G67_04710 [Acinetobacter sp.]|nr:hypothetical protein [Acinetobacter sp.]